MFFRQLLHEEKSCLSYVIGCSTYGVCAVVDPQGEERVYTDLTARHGLKIQLIIETHIQADHYSAAERLASATQAPIYFGPTADVGFPHQSFRDGQEFTIGNRRVQVFHTPGHTPEHITLYVDGWLLVTGDTLFVGDVGRVDLALHHEPGSRDIAADARTLYRSLQRLLKLPDWTEVYPGHYGGSVCGRGIDGKPSTTLGRERQRSTTLGLAEDEFIAWQTINQPPLPEDFANIIGHNRGR